MTLSTTAKARLRLAVVALTLVPVALLARAVASGRLSEFVQRGWATAWKHYDTTVQRDASEDSAP
jgi:hypothetical protein